MAGCDYAERRATDGERADKLYRAAMEEYAAGRLDKSIEGFEKVLQTNPGNASARFQLACLLQDHRKDPLGAICNYREYKTLFPNGDKVKIADERASACERQLAGALIKKFDLGGSEEQAEANARLKADNAKLSAELDTARKESEKLVSEIAALKRENARVRRMVLAESEDEPSANVAESKLAPVARAEDAQDVVAQSAKKDLADDDAADVDRVKFSADVDKLIAEERSETSQSSPFGKTVRKEAKPRAVEPDPFPPLEKRPPTYVVQEGDTLFKLAIRFYGRRSAWSKIRDANKATVSTDGRIIVGQTLVLPQ